MSINALIISFIAIIVSLLTYYQTHCKKKAILFWQYQFCKDRIGFPAYNTPKAKL